MKQILLVDDDPVQIEALTEKLTAIPFTVLSAKNGMEALRAVEANTIDLIILDLMMPEMDGQNFVYQLDKLGKGSIPIIILTNVRSTAYPDKVSEYLVKADTSLAKLVEIIKKYVPV